MSNDNKTLADVQPGGRVRLGDAPWPEIDAILADAYSSGAVGLPFEGIARRHAVCAAVAALAAQPSPGATALGIPIVVDSTVPPDTFEVRRPSPGGQDALKALVARWRAEAAAHELNGLEADSIGLTVAAMRNDARHHVLEAAADELEAALAARQPVTMDDALAAGDGTLHGAIDHWQERALRAEAELAARQPVGQEPLWCLHVLGMDDVHPAPSKAHAEKAAAWHNEQFKDQAARLGISIEAKVVPWPHSAESHAAGVAEFIPQWLVPQWQLDALESTAARQPADEVSVKKEDANNYCLILRALGMEEEGDPVAEVQALIEARDRQPVGEPVELACVAETLANGAGLWMSCSGCHESNEGAPTGPYSTIMQCHLGNGCDECGGIGAIWDTTDYQQMADEMAKSLAAPSAQAVDLGEMPDGWRLSKKATCYQLSHGNEIIGNLVGPDAEENAAIIARVLDSQAVGK